MNRLNDEIVKAVQEDLAAFRDPGTLIDGGETDIVFQKDRRPVKVKLNKNPQGGFPEIQLADGRRFTYQGFLVSEVMADLDDLAISIQQQIPDVDGFVAAPALSGADPDSRTEADALDSIARDAIDNLPFSATRVLFILANAGAGKTSLLRQLTRRQADRFRRGEVKTLFLYLDAQGKGLAQLEDVISRALQDLRARFTYHCVAPLTRRGCIVPIIDGFDELIGPNSAREAFGNLAQFLAQLDQEGAVIASSRSAFVDYQTLHERATEIAAAQGLSYEIHPVTLLPWPDEKVFELVGHKLPVGSSGREQIAQLLQSEISELVRKPFFLGHICTILQEGQIVHADQDLVQQIVSAAIGREALKLRDRKQRQLLTEEQHAAFCRAIADEMWWQERPDLDLTTIRTIAEMFADQSGLPLVDAKVLVDRSIAHGLLTVTQGDAERRGFEHELFQFEFQAVGLKNALLGDEGLLRDYLTRREVPLDLAERAANKCDLQPDAIVTLCARMGALVRRSAANPFAAANSGTIFAALARVWCWSTGHGRLDGLQVRFADLGASVFRGWVASDCVFDRVDLTQAQFIDCDLSRSTFLNCSVSPNTRLSGSAMGSQTVMGLDYKEKGVVYDPEVVVRHLQDMGAKVAGSREAVAVSSITEGRVEILERFLTHAKTHFYSDPNEGWVKNRLRSDEHWEGVEKVLRKNGVLVDVTIDKSGPRTRLWKLTAPPDSILKARSGQGPDALLNLWEQLGAD